MALRIGVALAGTLGLVARAAPAATVLLCPFDSTAGWTVRSVGAARVATAERAAGNPCVEVRAERGTVFLTRELAAEPLRGARVTVGCLCRTEEVSAGPQQSSMAKVHLAVLTPEGTQHFAAEMTGSSDWTHRGFTADVPEDAARVILNLGLESCSGRAWFDDLVIRDDRRAVYPLDLAPVANASHGQLGIPAFPEGTVQWEGIPLKILDEARNDAGDCFRLKGVDHADWPSSIGVPIPVGRSATAIYILHAVLGGGQKSPTPCAMWTARFLGGHDSGLSVFEGRQIGAMGQTEDLENWHVAWQGEDAEGRPVTFGVTRWDLYTSEPVVSLCCRAYHGASPVVLAVTVVEEPPEPQPEPLPGQYDEMGGGFEEGGG